MTTNSLLSFIAIGGASLIIMVLERAHPYTTGQALLRKGFWNDLVMYTIVQSYFMSLVIAWVTNGIDSLTHLSRFSFLTDLPVWEVVLLSLVVHDFYIYWFHRLQHANRYLWRIHEAHHSVEDVDWLAGSRSHSLEILINQTVEFAPLVLLGAKAEVILVKATIDAIWGMYIHSNINIRSGFLQYFINGPEMHRWHHAKEIRTSGINYSTKFAIWDWLFRTAYKPELKKPAGFGIDEEHYPQNYFLQHLYSFRKFK